MARGVLFILLLLPLLSIPTISNAQTPGNIGTANLTAWFKPDALATGDVTTWTTSFPTGGGAITVTDALAPFPQATETPTGEISNYNMTIEFTDNTMASLKALQTTATLNLLDNATAVSEGTFFGTYYLPETTANDHMMLYNEPGNDAIQFRNLGANGRLALGRALFISTNASDDWPEDFIPTIISYKGNRSGASTMSSYERSLFFEGGGASQSSGPAGLYFGIKPSTATSPYNGYLHEFIFFNRDLTDLEMSKVHTYLGVKYGITLDNTGGGTQGDYVATNDAIIWDASVTPDFHQDVIGIGRDDEEALLQKQSHSFDDTTRIYISDLEATNSSNTGTFDANISYVTIGHNGDAICGVNEEIPATLLPANRLEREWKITKTNFDQTFNLDFTLNPCDPIAGFDPDLIRILVDDDTDLSDAASFGTADGLDFSIAGNILSITGISNAHIPNNSTRYLTVVYLIPEVEIDGLEEICVGDSVELFFDFIPELAPLTIDVTDGTTTFTMEDLNPGDGVFFTPEETTTYTVLTSASPLSCCGIDESEAGEHTVTVNPLPTVTLGADTTICEGDSYLLDAENPGSTYLWGEGETTQTIEVTDAGTYHVVVTDLNGCINSDTMELFIELPPNPGSDSSITVCNSSDEIDLNTLLSIDAELGGIWAETSPAPSGSFTALTGTLTILDLAAGTYNFTYSVSGEFCSDQSANFNVTVVDQPWAGENALTAICTEDDPVDLDPLLTAGVAPGAWTETTLPASEQFDAATAVFNPNGLTSGAYTFVYETDLVEPCPTTTALITVNVTENPSVDFSLLENEGCVPFDAYFNNLTTVEAGSSCLWTFGDGSISEFCGDVTHFYTIADCYDVSLTVETAGCSGSQSYEEIVCAHPIPYPNFEFNPQIVFTNDPLVEFTNTSDGASSFIWDFGDGANSEAIHPNHSFPESAPGIYNVTLYAISDFGCIDSVTQQVIVQEIQLFYIPNTFTPDGDNFNESFKPIMTAGYDPYDYHFTIYNRWGEIVFESYNAAFGWDGTYGNQIVRDGTYLWQVEFGDPFSDERYTHMGHVNLLR